MENPWSVNRVRTLGLVRHNQYLHDTTEHEGAREFSPPFATLEDSVFEATLKARQTASNCFMLCGIQFQKYEEKGRVSEINVSPPSARALQLRSQDPTASGAFRLSGSDVTS